MEMQKNGFPEAIFPGADGGVETRRF